jgi:hypothetical protein
MSPPLPPSPSLYGAIYKLTYSFVHFLLSFAAALFYQESRRPKAFSSHTEDLERGEVHTSQCRRPAAPILQNYSSSDSSRSERPSRQQQIRSSNSNSKRNVQFELPKTRASPPLGRIDLFSSSSTDSRSPMRKSLDRLRCTANPRAHHATYFLD